MSEPDIPPHPALVARLRELAQRRLTPEEVEAALRVPIGDEEREEILGLVDWFCRRYPTPADRLAYVRRAYRRWTRRVSFAESHNAPAKPGIGG